MKIWKFIFFLMISQFIVSLSVSDGTRELLHIDIPEIKVPQ